MKSLYKSIIFALLLALLSCGDQNPVGPDDVLTEPTALLESSKAVEKAMQNSDAAALKNLILPKNLSSYRYTIENNNTKLPGFAEVFQTRKLIAFNKIYAVYEVTFNGKHFEISMTLDEDGIWKLTDF